jgi:hypothetical protein
MVMAGNPELLLYGSEPVLPALAIQFGSLAVLYCSPKLLLSCPNVFSAPCPAHHRCTAGQIEQRDHAWVMYAR